MMSILGKSSIPYDRTTPTELLLVLEEALLLLLKAPFFFGLLSETFCCERQIFLAR